MKGLSHDSPFCGIMFALHANQANATAAADYAGSPQLEKKEMDKKEMDKYTVLLVDDEEEVIQVIMKKIDWEGLGFSVIGYANNGVRALEMVEEAQPDVVMTDIKMPYMDGWNWQGISGRIFLLPRFFCLPDLMNLNMRKKRCIWR